MRHVFADGHPDGDANRESHAIALCGPQRITLAFPVAGAYVSAYGGAVGLPERVTHHRVALVGPVAAAKLHANRGAHTCAHDVAECEPNGFAVAGPVAGAYVSAYGGAVGLPERVTHHRVALRRSDEPPKRGTERDPFIGSDGQSLGGVVLGWCPKWRRNGRGLWRGRLPRMRGGAGVPGGR